MLKPSIDELVSMAGSRYALVIATSKRARNIIEGDKVMIESELSKPVSIAVREFYNGKFTLNNNKK
jgi:DNA-directed RNA polymerase subunit omega